MKSGRKKKSKSIKKNKKQVIKPASSLSHLEKKAFIQAQKLKKLVTKKKRGKNVYSVELPKFVKTKKVLEEVYSKVKLGFKKFPNDQVKVTLFASDRKHKGGMTYVYDLPKSGTVKQNEKIFNQILNDMTGDIFKARTRQQDGYLKHATVKDRINRIIIDFDTAS